MTTEEMLNQIVNYCAALNNCGDCPYNKEGHCEISIDFDSEESIKKSFNTIMNRM